MSKTKRMLIACSPTVLMSGETKHRRSRSAESAAALTPDPRSHCHEHAGGAPGPAPAPSARPARPCPALPCRRRPLGAPCGAAGPPLWGMEGESTSALLSGFVFGALAFQHLSAASDTVRAAGPGREGRGRPWRSAATPAPGRLRHRGRERALGGREWGDFRGERRGEAARGGERPQRSPSAALLLRQRLGKVAGPAHGRPHAFGFE